jgi:hypothetical protein
MPEFCPATFAEHCGFSALVARLVLGLILARAHAKGLGAELGAASLDTERMLDQGSGS